MNVIEKYNRRVDKSGSLLCIGLDSDLAQLPDRFRHEREPQLAFNRWIIQQTHTYASAYKLNTAFYEAQGESGWNTLTETVRYLQNVHPDIVTICDAKRGDVESTNEAYAKAIFDYMAFDAVTLHPYLGYEALQPFLRRTDKSAIILCRTSNLGAREIQDLPIDGRPLWQIIAEKVSREWNIHHNCMLVVGATYPDELRSIREITGNMTFLVPGIGIQGGDIHQVVRAGLNADGRGLIISASRSIIFSVDPMESARWIYEQISLAVESQLPR